MNARKQELLRIPPHSVEAEQSVIGGLLLSNDSWDDISPKVTETDFYMPEHQSVFGTIKKLFIKQVPVDLLTVTNALKENGKLDDVGEAYLYEMVGRVPSAANIVAYADIVRQRSIKRQVLKAAQEVADLVYKDDFTADELLSEFERRTSVISNTGVVREPAKIRKTMADAFERLSGPAVQGLNTGFKDFDHITSGLQKGDLIILAGRPGMGKTALALNMVEHIAGNHNHHVLIHSMEMSKEQLALRFISSLGKISQNHIRIRSLSSADWERIGDVTTAISQTNIYIDDSCKSTAAQIRSTARRLMKQCGGLSLIVVDYLGLLHDPTYKNNRANEVGAISRDLKALARELNIPVLALCQLNRGSESRGDKRPVMSDLKDSSAIESDADIVAFIYRDEVYNENTNLKGIAELIIAKHRNGPTDKVVLRFLGEFTRFENIVKY